MTSRLSVQAYSIVVLCTLFFCSLPTTLTSAEPGHSRSVPQWTIRVAEVLDEQRWRVQVIAHDGDYGAKAPPTPSQAILIRSRAGQTLGPAGSLFTLAVEVSDPNQEPPIYTILGLPTPIAPPASNGPEPTVSDEAAFRAELVRRMTLSSEDIPTTAPIIEQQATPTTDRDTPVSAAPQPAIIIAVVLGGSDPQLVEYAGSLRRGSAQQSAPAHRDLSVLHRDGRFALIGGLRAKPGDMVHLRQGATEGQP